MDPFKSRVTYVRRAVMSGKYQDHTKETLEDCVKRLVCECIKLMTVEEIEDMASIRVNEDIFPDGTPNTVVEVAIKPPTERTFEPRFDHKNPDTVIYHDPFKEDI